MQFGELYERYFREVYLYMLRLSGNEDAAEEITEETFFKALRSIDSFRGECSVYAWLCQIAKNCYYTYIKKNSRMLSLEGENPEIPAGTERELEEIYSDKDEALRIKGCCTRFPTLTRKSLCGGCSPRWISAR